MILRIVGAFLVAGCAVSLSLFMVEGLKNRVRTLSEFLRSLEWIRSEIQFNKTPLNEIFEMLGKEIEGHAGAFFSRVYQMRCESEGTPLALTLVKAAGEIPGESGLTKADRGVIKELSASLGKYDLEAQDRALALAIRRLERGLEEAKKKLGQDGKLYRTLGVTSGFLMFIFLI